MDDKGTVEKIIIIQLRKRNRTKDKTCDIDLSYTGIQDETESSKN